MPMPVDFDKFVTGTPVWRIRTDYVLNQPGSVISDSVLLVDNQNRRLVTCDFPEEAKAFRLENPKDGYLYMTEPVTFESWLLFQDKQAAENYLERQTLLQEVWSKTTKHSVLRKCSTAQLRTLLQILNNPDE